MKTPALLALLLSLCAGAQGADLTAKQLIARVEDAQKSSGFRIRAKLVSSRPDSAAPEVKQLLIRGRQHDGTKQVIYQVLWPKPVAGEALLVETSPQGAVSGLLQSHKGQLTLTPQLMAQPLFNSAIAIEDVAENFWHWPLQELKGEEIVSGRSCTILESHPGSGTATSYSLVRSCVSPELALPLRVEKFGKDGRLRRRFIASKIMKRPHGRWTAAIVTVESADGRARTTLEGSRAERDIEIPADQFTPQAISRLRASP
jgi:hypothetical protein